MTACDVWYQCSTCHLLAYGKRCMHRTHCRLADATSAAQQISSVMADGSDGAPDSDALSQLSALPRAQVDADTGPAAVPATRDQQQHEPGQPCQDRASAGSLGAAGLPPDGLRLSAGHRMLVCVYVNTIITKHHDAMWGSDGTPRSGALGPLAYTMAERQSSMWTEQLFSMALLCSAQSLQGTQHNLIKRCCICAGGRSASPRSACWHSSRAWRAKGAGRCSGPTHRWTASRQRRTQHCQLS
jgi:hypothetical protein